MNVEPRRDPRHEPLEPTPAQTPVASAPTTTTSGAGPATHAAVAAPPAPPTSPAPPAPPPPGRAVDRRADEATRAFVDATHAQASRAPDPPRFGDGILYVGMNSKGAQAQSEAQVLRRAGSGVRDIVGHAEADKSLGADHVRLADGSIVDVGSPEGAHTFAASLGLPSAQTERVAEVLVGANAGSRDELAGMAKVFAVCERGGDSPSRLVISGHCAGTTVWDGGDAGWGELRLGDVFSLADAMPRAAAQVEDVMLSACSSGYDRERAGSSRVALESWREHFPNLKTAWGYGGDSDYHSPTGEVANAHLAAWEKATRGRADSLHARRDLQHVPDAVDVHAANVSTWSVRQGYLEGKR